MELLKLVDFNSLTDEEKKALYMFEALMKTTNYKDLYTFETYKEIGFGIYKKDGVWQAYITEHDQQCLLKVYNSVYDACIDMFNNLSDYSKEYCIDMFNKLIQEDYSIETINEYFNNITKENNKIEDKKL